MPSFSDVVSPLVLSSCCMRKNPTPVQRVQDDVMMLTATLAVYVGTYYLGWNSLCILSLGALNVAVLQLCMNYRRVYVKEVHLNQFDELDVSTNSESSSVSEELSLKQKEQGATVSKALTLEEEETINEQLQNVVEETTLRNRKRVNTPRTPSSSTLVEDLGLDSSTQYQPALDTEDEYADMPPLVSGDDSNPVIVPTPDRVNRWLDVPNFSQTHYLHAFGADELD